MDLPDESQWDETTCNLAVCQHPQCWATIRRIERGHPRILGSPCKTPLDVDDKLPAVTIVNISGSCLQAKRRPHHHLPGFTFTKPRSLLSQGSKLDSKFQGRPRKDLPDKDSISCTTRSSKLPVLNLNQTQLPSSQDVGNMVVIWIPKEPEDHVRPAEKHIVPSQDGKKKRKTPKVKDTSSLPLSGKQGIEARLEAPGIIVPPLSPAHLFEQPSSELLPFWNQSDTLPQDLLNDLLSDEEKTMPCLELKTQLAMMKKKSPLEKSRPDSAISSKMFLSVHRLTLQRPALRYPDYLRKLDYSLKIESQRKRQRQQQRPAPAKNQEARKKSKSDPGSHSTSLKRLGASVCGPRHEEAERLEGDEQAHVTEEKTPEGPLVHEAGEGQGPPLKPQRVLRKQSLGPSASSATGHRTRPGQQKGKKQQWQMKKKDPTLKQDSAERPQVDHAEDYLDSFTNPKLSRTESANGDISPQIKVVPDKQEEMSWNPELKLLRILQATDDENEENQLFGRQGEESLEAQAEVITG